MELYYYSFGYKLTYSGHMSKYMVEYKNKTLSAQYDLCVLFYNILLG